MEISHSRRIDIDIENRIYTCELKTYKAVSPTTRSTTLFIQGLADSYLNYHHILQPLSETSTIITMDLPGFGLSQQEIYFSYNQKNIATIITQMLSTINLQSEVHLIGVSIGANIALMMYQMFKYNIDFRHVILITPVFSQHINVQLRWLSLPWNRYVMKFMMKPNIARQHIIQSLYFRMVLSSTDFITEDHRRLYLLMFGNSIIAKPYHSILFNYLSLSGLKSRLYTQIWEILHHTQQKDDFTVIMARHDKIVDNKEIHDRLRTSGFDNTFIFDSGHSIHIETPERLLNVLRTQLGC